MLQEYNEEKQDNEQVIPLADDQENEESGDHISPFTPQELRTKRIQTLSYFMNFLSLGIAVGIVGPTLWALSINTGKSIEDLGAVFSSRAAGWMAGSLIGGKLYDTVRKGHRILSLAVLACALGLILMPLVKSYIVLLAMNLILGIFMSFLDVGTNALLITVWTSKHAGPYLQFLHFGFGAGATIAPFFVGVFMSILNDSVSSVAWAYWFLALLTLLSGIPTMILSSPSLKNEESEDSSHDEKFQLSALLTLKFWRIWFSKYLLVLLVGFYLLAYVGAETSYGGWIFTYAVKVYNMERIDAAYLSSLFWCAMTLGRLSSVYIATKITAKKFLFIDMVGCTTCIFILLSTASLKSVYLLWILTVLLGFFMASIFASAFSLPGEFTGKNTSSKEASVMIVLASIGDMGIPGLVGVIMSSVNVNAFLWSILCAFLFAELIFAYLHFRYKEKKDFKKGNDFELLQEDNQ